MDTYKCLKTFRDKNNKIIFKKNDYYGSVKEEKIFSGFTYTIKNVVLKDKNNKEVVVHLSSKKEEISLFYFIKTIPKLSVDYWHNTLNNILKKGGGIPQTQLKNISLKWEEKFICGDKTLLKYNFNIDGKEYPAFGVRTITQEYEIFSFFYIPFFNVFVPENMYKITTKSSLNRFSIKPKKNFYTLTDEKYFRGVSEGKIII